MKRLLCMMAAWLLAWTMVLPVALADEGDKKSGDFTYRLKGNGTAVITGYEGTSVEVFVPRMVDGYTVTEIGENAFSAVESGYGKIITLPDTITVIGDRAFEKCKASVINISDSVQSIGDFAFQSCENIQTVSIPAGVERIGTGAFARCSSIKEFYVDSQNAVYATIDGVLYNKQKKELVVFPQGEYSRKKASIPSGIESIASYAFVGMENYSFNLPDTIKTIGDYAFANITFAHPKTGIQLPAALEHIGNHAFEGAKLELVKFGSNLKTIGDYAFSYAWMYTDSERGRKEYTYHTYWYRDLILPDSIQTIGEAAFQGIYGLRNIDLSKTQIRIIEPRTFMNVHSAWSTSFLDISYGETTILLPSSVQEIKEEAFFKAELGDIKMENAELENIGERAFAEIDMGRIDFIGVKIKEIKEEAFLKAKTGSIEIESVEIIGERAFANADTSDITIGSVKMIGERAFENASSSIYINSVEVISNAAFYDGSGSVHIENDLKEIGDQAFYGRKMYQDFIFPSTVTTIGSEVFKDARELKTITIPASVERIGEDLCNKAKVVLEVEKGSYAEMYALENGYQIKREANTDTSWLNN